MEYFLTFFAGVITFISPCLLPLIPIYISYISLDNKGSKKDVFINSLGFTTGFSVVFTILGAIFSTLSLFINSNSKVIGMVSGTIVIFFGLSNLGVLKVNFFSFKNKSNINLKKMNFIKSLLFGIIFATTMSPCLNAFLGTAILLTVNTDTVTVLKGTILMLTFSIGLGIPFIVTAMLFDKLKEKINSINNNSHKISVFSGIFIIVIGLLIFFDKINLFTEFFL